MTETSGSEPPRILEKYNLPAIYNRAWQMLRAYGEPVQRTKKPATEVGFICDGCLEEMTEPVTLRLLGDNDNKLLITYETSTRMVKLEMNDESDAPTIQALKKDGVIIPDADYAGSNPEDVLPNIIPLLDNAEDAIKLAQYLRRTTPIHPEPFSWRRALGNLFSKRAK